MSLSGDPLERRRELHVLQEGWERWPAEHRDLWRDVMELTQQQISNARLDGRVLHYEGPYGCQRLAVAQWAWDQLHIYNVETYYEPQAGLGVPPYVAAIARPLEPAWLEQTERDIQALKIIATTFTDLTARARQQDGDP